MTWTKEPPTKPGLYAWCDGRGGGVYLFTVLSDEDVVCHNGVSGPNWTPRLPQRHDGLWQPLTVELPEPYVPPKPPKVEWYSAKRNGKDLWLLRVGRCALALAGEECSDKGFWDWCDCQRIFKDIERVPDETST